MESFLLWLQPLINALPADHPNHPNEKPLSVYAQYMHQSTRVDPADNQKWEQLVGIMADQERVALLHAYLDADAHFGIRHSQAKKSCMIYDFGPHFHAHTQVQ